MASERRARHRSRPPELGGPPRSPGAKSVETKAEAPAAPSPQALTPPRDYEVGYKKPPKDTRFKPGRSGNPRGRPKGSKNLAALVDRELDSKVLLREGGKASAVSKRVVIAKQIVKKAVEGDLRTVQTLLKLADLMTDEVAAVKANEDAAHSEQPLAEEDHAILAALTAQIRDGILGESDAGDSRKKLGHTPEDEEQDQ